MFVTWMVKGLPKNMNILQLLILFSYIYAITCICIHCFINEPTSQSKISNGYQRLTFLSS